MRETTKARLFWGQKLGRLTKNLDCLKRWSENNFLTFVTAKGLENFISGDWAESREFIPVFNLHWEFGTALSTTQVEFCWEHRNGG